MTRIRNWLLTASIALALLLLPLASFASADPGDGGGFSDPTITTSGVTVHITSPGDVTVTRKSSTRSATADPGDGGGFGN